MKSTLIQRSALCAAVLLGGLVSSGNLRADDYVLDDQHTSVVFAVNHFGYSYCYGMFGKYSGKFKFDPKNIPGSQFRFTIDASTLDTKSLLGIAVIMVSIDASGLLGSYRLPILGIAAILALVVAGETFVRFQAKLSEKSKSNGGYESYK